MSAAPAAVTTTVSSSSSSWGSYLFLVAVGLFILYFVGALIYGIYCSGTDEKDKDCWSPMLFPFLLLGGIGRGSRHYY